MERMAASAPRHTLTMRRRQSAPKTGGDLDQLSIPGHKIVTNAPGRAAGTPLVGESLTVGQLVLGQHEHRGQGRLLNPRRHSVTAPASAAAISPGRPRMNGVSTRLATTSRRLIHPLWAVSPRHWVSLLGEPRAARELALLDRWLPADLAQSSNFTGPWTLAPSLAFQSMNPCWKSLRRTDPFPCSSLVG